MRISDWSSDVCSSDLSRTSTCLSGEFWDMLPVTSKLILPCFQSRAVLCSRSGQVSRSGRQRPRGAMPLDRGTACPVAPSPHRIEVRRRLEEAALSEVIVCLDYLAQTFFGGTIAAIRSEEHTTELQSLMRISYAVF